MIRSFNLWWNERAPRERVLLSVMFALLAAVMLWFGIVRPIEGGLVSVRQDYIAALDRNAAVRARVTALDRAPPRRGQAGASKPLQQRIADSAGEAGFTLGSNTPTGNGGVQISIGSVRPGAFFSWLSILESQGVSVQTLSATPSGVGTITVSAVLHGR